MALPIKQAPALQHKAATRPSCVLRTTRALCQRMQCGSLQDDDTGYALNIGLSISRRSVLLSSAAVVALSVPPPSLASPGSPFAQPGTIAFTEPTPEILKQYRVQNWAIWQHGVDTFPYVFSGDEDCYFLAGRVIVTPDGGEPVEIKNGDFVTFPKGLSCTWDIKEPARKHYKEYSN